MKSPAKADPDETDGRKLYRDIADQWARYQVNMSRRRVRLRDTQEREA